MDERKAMRGLEVNLGYAHFQIAKALVTSERDEDAATRERARRKIAKWLNVLSRAESGSLNVGSRTPLAGVPAWATLEVVTGGFATGELLAAGPLLDHERAFLARLGLPAEADARRALNAYFLSDEGLAELLRQLHSGCYDVGVPEEGALLVVAWLVDNGHSEEAHELLDELVPYFPQLRFYPVPAERPRRSGSRVCVQDVGDTVARVIEVKPNAQVMAQKEAIQVWIPMYDRMVALFLETIARGGAPNLRCDAHGKRLPRVHGKFPVEGGWPCAVYPPGWADRARALLAEYERARADHRLCGRPECGKDSFAQLRGYLHRCAEDAASLTGRDVGRIRLILARYVAKRGLPDSERCRLVRGQQRDQARAPTHHQLAQVLVARFQPFPADEGLDDVTALAGPVTEDESGRSGVPVGTRLPTVLRRKVERCLSDTVEVLVERGVITSGELLARVLPQVTSGLRALGMTDPALRGLYAAVYRAFRRRRSLLLLNLESQVRIEELPWVAAIEPFRSDNLPKRELARQTLEETAILTLVSFPHVLLPNKLVQELRALAKMARLDVPLVDELAADIFMGTLTDKFRQAAVKAANLLEGTIYQTYYAIDFDAIRAMPEFTPPRRAWFARGGPVNDPLCELCAARAGVRFGSWDPATNGMILEQEQILTTHNLAPLFSALDLSHHLSERLLDMAERCFTWICARQQVRAERGHARLIMLKSTAYAWRQMIFYLALVPRERVRSFAAWAQEHLARQRPDFRTRFAPALKGLALAADGLPVAADPDARHFLGWSIDRHWLLD